MTILSWDFWTLSVLILCRLASETTSSTYSLRLLNLRSKFQMACPSPSVKLFWLYLLFLYFLMKMSQIYLDQTIHLEYLLSLPIVKPGDFNLNSLLTVFRVESNPFLKHTYSRKNNNLVNSARYIMKIFSDAWGSAIREYFFIIHSLNILFPSFKIPSFDYT